jgi:hypothetical protein
MRKMMHMKAVIAAAVQMKTMILMRSMMLNSREMIYHALMRNQMRKRMRKNKS